MRKCLLAALLGTSMLCYESMSPLPSPEPDWQQIDYSDLPFFVLWGSGPVATERLDPIMSSGRSPSQHMHEFLGADIVRPELAHSDLQKATCSTFQVRADKSSYWTPALYFQEPDTGSFILVKGKPGNRRKIYYSYKTSIGTVQPDISAFPRDFRMVTGDPHTTTLNAVGNCSSAECGYHQMAGKVTAWTCQGVDGATSHAGFPQDTTACPHGLRVQAMFPDCWNGRSFDPEAPYDHVMFSTGDGGTTGCPSTHRAARFPQIYLEINYDIDQFNGRYTADDQPFVLAFGDKTGFGFHADFINGWDDGALESLVSTCRKGDASNPQSLADGSCFGRLGGLYSSDQVSNCSSTATTGPDVDAILTALPGCQTLFSVGSTVDLKVCDGTFPTVSDDVIA